MKLLLFLLVQSLWLRSGAQRLRPWTDRDCRQMLHFCGPVSKGIQGRAGLKGYKGHKGSHGVTGILGPSGPMGPLGRSRPGPPGPRPKPGPPGDPGETGARGMNGFPGDPGAHGTKGRQGYSGFPGVKGSKGDLGIHGSKGLAGEVGEPGLEGSWWRCTWSMDASIDNGVLEECDFRKSNADSVLRVVFEGNLQLGLCQSCCKRWYFTFNGAECAQPTSVDAVMSGGLNHYPFYTYGRIEGYCETKFTAGLVRVAMSIENCVGFTGSPAPAHGPLYKPNGSILIQEVSASQ